MLDARSRALIPPIPNSWQADSAPPPWREARHRGPLATAKGRGAPQKADILHVSQVSARPGPIREHETQTAV
eukprot:scaffold37082_cov80-Phaeocystis_antarctica.AAC.1